MHFSENIKRIRIEKGLTQKQLADAINVTRPTISFYESGRVEPSLEKLLMLSDTLKVTVDELLKEENYEGC